MKISELLSKISKGEDLTEDEKKFLSSYQEPGDNSADLEKLRSQIATLTAENKALSTRAKNAESKGLTDIERITQERDSLTASLAALTNERDTLAATLNKERHDNAVSAIAAKYKCDPEYLAFKLNGTDKDLKNETVVSSLIEDLKKSAPRFFDADVHSGGAELNLSPNNKDHGSDRLKELLAKENLTPVEQLECMKLARETHNETDTELSL